MVNEIRYPQGGIYPENITPFKGKNDKLSNFYPCKINVFERSFKLAEHAYQFMKAMAYGKEQIAQQIYESQSACTAKQLGGRVATEQSWETEKIEIMRHIIRAKAKCVPEYRQELLRTREIIVEAVPGERFWSCGLSKEELKVTTPDEWPGANTMGKLHMELKEEIMVERRSSEPIRTGQD